MNFEISKYNGFNRFDFLKIFCLEIFEGKASRFLVLYNNTQIKQNHQGQALWRSLNTGFLFSFDCTHLIPGNGPGNLSERSTAFSAKNFQFSLLGFWISRLRDFKMVKFLEVMADPSWWIENKTCYHEPEIHDHELYWILYNINLYILLPLAIFGLFFNGSALVSFFEKLYLQV